ncbi:peptide MFS transporter [Falsarthrobacter nasiphocae]|uniref:POT family proton-dependent oligopeptide transporter n=1 Tax=Falsarthrobacter nasiphocae TaxID=189863 RepID=A0AAE3YGT3_9MICC|nr:POT family proton-dependent oligopeptide transporter [Falsarthrobacter nasiphocae]
MLFTLEMWERFSFYGLQGILAYYMYYSATEGGLGMDKATALGIVGAYGGTVFLMTIMGAWVADRVLGKERTLFISGILIMLGHVSLALLPGQVGLLIGLIFVAIGSGGLKANATAVVGTLYERKDPKRDAGFSIFYMGVNIGALFGPLVTGWLKDARGFHWGFGAAAVGMAIGLIVYSMGRKRFPEAAYAPADPLEGSQRKLIAPVVVGGFVVMGLALWLGLATDTLDWVIFGVALFAALAFFTVMLRDREVTGEERSRVKAFIPLFVAATLFWSLFQQQFTFIALYSDTRLNRSIGGWEFPASWVQSINAVFVIIFAGVLSAMWTRLGTRAPATPRKFAISLVLIGFAYFVFLPFANGKTLTPVLVLVAVLFLFTMGELLLSPIGLSLATKLAPAKFPTQMVALNFLASSIGTTLAGTVAKYYDPTNEVPYFVSIGLTSVVCGVILFVASKRISALMKGVL